MFSIKLSRENDYSKCIEYINEYKSIFPHFYLEMQSHLSKINIITTKNITTFKDTNTYL